MQCKQNRCKKVSADQLDPHIQLFGLAGFILEDFGLVVAYTRANVLVQLRFGLKIH